MTMQGVSQSTTEGILVVFIFEDSMDTLCIMLEFHGIPLVTDFVVLNHVCKCEYMRVSAVASQAGRGYYISWSWS